MKRTQKALAAVTALALAASLAVPTFAAEGNTKIDDTTTDKKAEIEVTATYDLKTVYHVDIAWNDMSFTYEPGTWTPEGDKPLTYTQTGERVGWNDYGEGKTASHKITVTNKSNSNVSVKIEFKPIDAEAGRIQGVFYGGHNNGTKIETDKGIWMSRADANVYGLHGNAGATTGGDWEAETKGKAVTAEIDFYLIGRPKNAYHTDTNIGNVTITIEGVDTEPDPSDTTYSCVYTQPSDDAESNMST